jgi:hypothetical protein
MRRAFQIGAVASWLAAAAGCVGKEVVGPQIREAIPPNSTFEVRPTRGEQLRFGGT